MAGGEGDCCVVVVGAGAAGALTASHLVTGLSSRYRVVLVDPAPTTGRGTAYSTSDDRHLLNVPASGMSAFPRDPEHFFRWVRPTTTPRPSRRTSCRDASTAATSSRCWRPRPSTPATPGWSARSTRSPASSAAVTGSSYASRSCEAIVARAVVLATGTRPGTDWAPAELGGHLVADPWTEELPEGDLLLVGTGLTMVDVAIAADRPGPRAAHGLAPRPVPAGAPHAHDPGGATAPGRHPDRHARRSCGRSSTSTWRTRSPRPATGARPSTGSGRSPPSCGAGSATRTSAPSSPTTPAPGTCTGTGCRRSRPAGWTRSPTPGGWSGTPARSVRPRSRRRRRRGDACRRHHARVAAVVNCTGPVDAHRPGPAARQRWPAPGLVRPGPAGLGVDTADDGRVLGVLPAPCRSSRSAPLRRGNLWETTAMPEIREQAYDVARAVVRALHGETRRRPDRRLRPRPDHEQGGRRPTTRRSAGCCACRTASRTGWRRRSSRTPASPRPTPRSRCSATSGAPPAPGAAPLRAAHAAAADRHLDDREVSFLDAVTTRLRADEATGAAALLRHIRLFPRDALAVSVAVPTVAFGGLTSGRQTADLVEGLGRSYGDDWWYAGQLAFVRQDQERWDEAEALASYALSVEPVVRPRRARPRPRVLRDRPARGRAGLARRAGSAPAGARPTTARTSPGTPRCTSWCRATSTRSAAATRASSRRRW